MRLREKLVGMTMALIIGGYTRRDDLPAGAPRGLGIYEWDGTTRLAAQLDIDNPTWFDWDARRRVLYVSQSNATTLTAVAIPEGPASARILDTVDTGAEHYVHLAVAPTGDAVVAACFGEGRVVTVNLAEDGRFDGVRGVESFDGPSDPHQISFGPGGFAVPDRSRGQIHRFSWEAGEAPRLLGSDEMPAGAGPRHMARHPHRDDVAYLAGEWGNSLVVLRVEEGAFVPVSELSTLPGDWPHGGDVSAIFVDAEGARVYVSNRGHDSLAVFDIADPLRPRLERFIDAGGATPRYAGELAPGVLAVAPMDAHAIDVLAGGERMRIPFGAPACAALVRL